MTQPVEQPVPLGGLAAEVTRDGILALLIGRPPDCLDDPKRQALFERIARGVAAEVAAVTGREPAGELRDLAVWATELGTAAKIEAALFPEGAGIGDTGRAEVLQRQFLGVKADLKQASTGGIAGGAFSGVVHVARGGWST